MPKIQITQNPNELTTDAIARITWDQLNHPISRATTLDGRNIIIVKGLSRKVETNEEEDENNSPQTESVLAFVEKCGPRDIRSMFVSNFPRSVDSFLHAIFYQANVFESTPCSSGAGIGSEYNRNCQVRSFISGEMANEFFVQLNK